jgi:hypothetical protein
VFDLDHASSSVDQPCDIVNSAVDAATVSNPISDASVGTVEQPVTSSPLFLLPSQLESLGKV